MKEQDTVPPVPLIEPLVVSSEVANEYEAVTSAGDAGREGEMAEADEEVAGNDVSEQVDSAVACENLSLGCPSLVDMSDVSKLSEEVKEDDTLKQCRELGSLKRNGYVWRNELLFQQMIDDAGNLLSWLVLPVGRQKRVLSLAHDFTGHVGDRRTKQLLNSRFTWPGMGKDVLEFVQSCDACLHLNKTGNRQVHMVERPIVTESFESVAVDIVGPLPKGKGGAKFILTFIRLATRWPEAVPMKMASASEVADGLVSIFSHTSFPLKILSDRGSVFTGKVTKRLYEIVGVDSIHTYVTGFWENRPKRGI